MSEPASQPAPSIDSDPEARLERALGVRSLAATIFNYTVGSGIFALPAVAVAQLGGAAPLAYLVCAVVMGCVVLCFAEAGSRIALTGGPYAYVEIALGPLVGFVTGVMLFASGLSAGAAVAVAFAESVGAALPEEPRWLSSVLIIAVLAVLAAINVRGVRRSAKAIELLTAVKLVPLVLFVVVGVAFVHREHLAPGAMPPLNALLGTAGVVIFAFSGIESALTPSGEVRSPNITVPRASFIALGGATLLYLAIQWTALGVVGPQLAHTGTTPLAAAAGEFAGRGGRLVMIVAASVSMAGYLSGNMLAVPRSLYAFARDGFLPRRLSAVHPRYRAPHVAVVTYALAMGALALSGTFRELAVLSNLTAFVVYILSAIGVLALRRRDVREAGAPFLVPGGPLVPLAACVLNLGLILETARRPELLGLAAMAGVAFALYALRRLRGAQR